MDKQEPELPKIEFLIGTPSRMTINAGYDDYLQSWTTNHPVGKLKAISNRVDWNRTMIWHSAKKYDTSLLMLDTDVYPITPYEQTKNYIYEDFANGYDVVFAPLLSHSGQLLFQATNPQSYKKKTPYDAFYSGFGFTAFSKRLVRTLMPLTHVDIIKESLDMLELPEETKASVLAEIHKAKDGNIPPIIYNALGASLPIYFSYSAQLSEDSQFCKRMRDMGIKMAIDPRIECKHMTEVPFIFNVDQVTKAMEAQEKQKKEEFEKAIAKRKEELANDSE